MQLENRGLVQGFDKLSPNGGCPPFARNPPERPLPQGGFDRLSPNGGCPPFAQNLSELPPLQRGVDKLGPNGGCHPFAQNLSKHPLLQRGVDKLSPNGGCPPFARTRLGLLLTRRRSDRSRANGGSPPFALSLSKCASAVALLATLAAHAQASPRLLVWINGDKGYNGLQKVGDAFTAKSGVPVVVQHPEGAPDKFQSAAAAGKGPDIMCWPHDRVGEWAKGGLIVPIRPGRALRERIDESAWQAFRYRGQTWGYPIAIEAVGLIVNRALVPEPPTSFEQIIEIDRKLKAASGGRTGAILWAYNNSFFSWGMFAGPGGYVFGRNAQGELDPTQVGVNSPGALQGVLMLERLIRDGHMPRGARYAEMESAFAKGQVAMMINGPWAWDNVRKVGIDFTVAPLPSVGGKPSRPFVGVLGCMITAPSRVKDIAREFLEHHLLKVENLKIVSADVPLGVPADKAYYAELSSEPKIAAANARAGEPIPNIPEMGRFFPAMDAALEAVTSGRQAPKEALDGAAARMRSR
jgi:maltose/maltodextrin transport system substrate-binding protein